MSNNPHVTYLAGMQEVVGKTVSFVLTTIFFVLYAFAKNDQNITLTYINVFAYLALFWFVYELITFVMYILFSLFLNGKNTVLKTESNDISTEPTIE
ncbi:MAG: hypothetical protein ACRCXZ_04040 [Patescibacteria group bacterium]